MCDEDFLVSRDFHRLVGSARGALWIASRTTRRALQFLIIGSSFIIPKAYHSCPPLSFLKKFENSKALNIPSPPVILLIRRNTKRVLERIGKFVKAWMKREISVLWPRFNRDDGLVKILIRVCDAFD